MARDSNRGRRRAGTVEVTRSSSSDVDSREVSAHKAALEALFSPKKPEGVTGSSASEPPSSRRSSRVVTTKEPSTDPETLLRAKLLGRLHSAESRPAVAKAFGAYTAAGFELPKDQPTMLQLLEHENESHIRDAIRELNVLLDSENPHRKSVLDARLRRLEDDADEAETRELAASLRRRVRELST